MEEVRSGLVDYKEDSSDSDDEFIVPPKRGRLDVLKKSGFLINAHFTLLSACFTVDNTLSRNCPYLDTIDRSVLDFDFEKLCSISLLNNNVYACLVCGKYFQGGASMQKDMAAILMTSLLCRSWTALACIHSQCPSGPSCVAQPRDLEILLPP